MKLIYFRAAAAAVARVRKINSRQGYRFESKAHNYIFVDDDYAANANDDSFLSLTLFTRTNQENEAPLWTMSTNIFFFNPGLFLFIFVLFSLQFQQYKLKQHKWYLGFEPAAAGW